MLEDNEARDVSNVVGTTNGAITKRNGFATFWTPQPGHSLNSIFVPVNGTLVVGIDNVTGNMLAFDGTSTYTLKTGLALNPWQFVRAPVVGGQGPTYGMNGANITPLQWNENVANSAAAWTATDTGGTVPNGNYCIYWNNQVFVSGVNAFPSRVYWSGIADPTAWNPANLNGSGFEDFDPNDGEAISGIGTVGPYLLVFKPSKTWVLINPATAQTRRLSDRIGCQAHRTIAAAPEGTYFLGGDSQVYLTNGSRITRISDKIRPTVQALAAPFAATYYDSHYLLSGSVPTVGWWTLDYDQRLQSWWKHTIGVRDWAVAPDDQVAGLSTLYAANSQTAFVSKAFASGVYTDNGQPMTWVWRGPWQSPSFYRRRRFPTPYFRKRLRQIRFEGSGTVDFSLARDFAGLETLVQANALATSSGSVTFGVADGTIFGGDNSVFGPATVQHARIFGQGVANVWSIVFGATSSTQDEIFEYVLMLADRRDGVVA